MIYRLIEKNIKNLIKFVESFKEAKNNKNIYRRRCIIPAQIQLLRVKICISKKNFFIYIKVFDIYAAYVLF